jgi:16S rRNA (uracil1498-N3)-methyltransferase
LELALEKATELGVSEIVLVDANRSEKGIERGAEKRMTRWRRILLEASQQSRRAQLPEISGPVRFADAIKAEATHRLFLDEVRTGKPILSAIPARSPEDSIALLVGPEGGWAETERALAKESGWTPVTLSTQVLRAETAAIAALAILGALYV